MPIYAYQCQECRHEFDKIQKISEPKLLNCPQCHQDSLKKLVCAPSFKLSGTGWYETDFKGKKAKPVEDSGTDTLEASNKPNSDTPKTTEPTKKATDAD